MVVVRKGGRFETNWWGIFFLLQGTQKRGGCRRSIQFQLGLFGVHSCTGFGIELLESRCRSILTHA